MGANLAGLRTDLEHFRAEAPQHQETRGASPRLTGIKHQLRDWVESQLGELPSDPNGADGSEVALAERLNAEFKREHLFGETAATPVANPDSAVGYLGPVKLEYRQRQAYLVLETFVGIQDCGIDESAYLYRWQDGHWKRIWDTEQSTYTKERYLPQFIRAVHVSPSFAETNPFILTLGSDTWCTSNWHDVYVRIWKVGPSGQEPKLLMDRSEWAYLGRSDVPIEGSIGRSDALIEYATHSIDGGVLTRETILHYSLTPDKVERIDPVALSPRDFVEEWLAEPWEQSQLHSNPSALDFLKKAHQDAGRDEFQPTRSCRTPEVWQVGLESIDGKKAPVYYFVRWRPPYHFTMNRASERPSPDCTVLDPAADDATRKLFPVQDWRE